MLVVLFSLAGLEDGHLPTFRLLLFVCAQCTGRNRRVECAMTGKDAIMKVKDGRAVRSTDMAFRVVAVS